MADGLTGDEVTAPVRRDAPRVVFTGGRVLTMDPRRPVADAVAVEGGRDEHRWLAFAGLAGEGVRLAASSDDPCAPFPPLWCAHKGVTRRTDHGIALDPDQTVPLEDWLAAYTIGAAVAGGQEAERGSLEAGKRADLVILQDVPDEGAGPLRVAETWVTGERVFVR